MYKSINAKSTAATVEESASCLLKPDVLSRNTASLERGRRSAWAFLVATTALVMSFVGFGVAGWLGGELVDRLSVGVDDGANLNAPNSLKGPIPKPARTLEANDSRFKHAA